MLLTVSQLLQVQQLLCRYGDVVAKHLALVPAQALLLLSPLFFPFQYSSGVSLRGPCTRGKSSLLASFLAF